MMKYNPDEHIDPEAWNASDQGEKIEAVRAYHRRQRIRIPNDRLHAVFHMVVENQVAMGDAYPTESVLCRLMREGLDRHEAIHAIASVLSQEMFEALKYKTGGDLGEIYKEKLVRLTAESWLRQEP